MQHIKDGMLRMDVGFHRCMKSYPYMGSMSSGHTKKTDR